MHFMPGYADKTPIPINLSHQNKISKLVKEILTQKKKNSTYNTIDLESQIDQLVYEMFGLTEDEIAIVEGKI